MKSFWGAYTLLRTHTVRRRTAINKYYGIKKKVKRGDAQKYPSVGGKGKKVERFGETTPRWSLIIITTELGEKNFVIFDPGRRTDLYY